MEITTVTTELNNGINDAVYCNLIDGGVNPDVAYEAGFGNSFDLEADASANPWVGDEPDLLSDAGYVETLFDTIQS